MALLNTQWLVETADRAIKSFAQSLILYFGAGETFVDAFEFDWVAALGFGLGGAVLSILTSMASGSFFKSGATTASILPPPSGQP